ncbi:MAG: hypothetical protein F4239_02160 [Gammaproteobacteria bacterium]|nr:hypothetical protein [Gammaproteobacteria bacterium]
MGPILGCNYWFALELRERAGVPERCFRYEEVRLYQRIADLGKNIQMKIRMNFCRFLAVVRVPSAGLEYSLNFSVVLNV